MRVRTNRSSELRKSAGSRDSAALSALKESSGAHTNGDRFKTHNYRNAQDTYHTHTHKERKQPNQTKTSENAETDTDRHVCNPSVLIHLSNRL